MDTTQPRQPARRALLVATLLTAVTACAADPTGPVIEEQLFGTWDWVRTETGVAGDVQTPDSVNFILRLVITTTRLEVLRDGDVEESARFRFVPGKDLDDTFVPPRLVYERVILGVTEHGVGFDGNHLVLFSTCCNPQTYVWTPAATN